MVNAIINGSPQQEAFSFQIKKARKLQRVMKLRKLRRTRRLRQQQEALHEDAGDEDQKEVLFD